MSYGMNENQNYFMEGTKTTSRVTNEPGGKSSVQLGWDSPKKTTESKSEKENNMKVVGKSAPNHSDYSKKENECKKKSYGGGGVSSNAYASGSSMNTGNVITDRPTSRVTQPPGGKSSISFY